MTCTWVCICLCWLTAKQVGKHTLSEGLLLKPKLAFILDCPKPATNLNNAVASSQVLKRTLQTALVWTLYDELMPAITLLGKRMLTNKQQQQQQGGGT